MIEEVLPSSELIKTRDKAIQQIIKLAKSMTTTKISFKGCSRGGKVRGQNINRGRPKRWMRLGTVIRKLLVGEIMFKSYVTSNFLNFPSNFLYFSKPLIR